MREEVKANCGAVGDGKRPYTPSFLSPTLVILKWQRQGHHQGPWQFSFWPRLAACGILAPQPGIQPQALAVKALSPNHWTARKFPDIFLIWFLDSDYPLFTFGLIITI